MSFTKDLYRQTFIQSSEKIANQTLATSNVQPVLDCLNLFLEIKDIMNTNNIKNRELWDEVVCDVSGAIHSTICGFYRPGIIALRSLLELSCMFFYFYNHEVEYYLYKNEDAKADKYVSVLVRDYDFFKTKYIKSFFPNITSIESESDAISKELVNLYKDLSDIVHGRYKTLVSKDLTKIEYSIEDYVNFEKFFTRVTQIICIMFSLLFDKYCTSNILGYAKNNGAIQ